MSTHDIYFYIVWRNKRTMIVLNAHLCWKVGQGHSMSTTFINLGDITLNISMPPHPSICKFNDHEIKTEKVVLMIHCKVKYLLFQQSRVYNSLTNNTIWPYFELFRDSIHVHLICKFQEDLIKTEWVSLMTKSNRDSNSDYFSNQGDVTLKLMIRSRQFLNSSMISSMSHLSASFSKIWSKLNKLCWWQSQTDYFSNQGDVTLKLMIWSRQFLNSSMISSISPLSASFSKVWSKLNKLCWWQSQTETISAIKGT